MSIIILFFLITDPHKVTSVLVFMMLYQLNIEIPFLLDARGMITILLFARLYFFDKENMYYTNKYFLANKYVWLIIAFTLSILLSPLVNNEKIIPHMRDIIISLVMFYIGFITVKNEEGRKAIVIGILAAGLISTIDLIYTFFIMKHDINTVKLPDLILLGKQTLINHNQPGFLAGMALIFVYLAWNRGNTSKLFLISLGLFLFTGVFISTSRSTLISLVLIFFTMTIIEHHLRHYLRKILIVAGSLFIILITFYFVYNTFLSGKASSYYIDKMYYRFYEEPIAMITGDLTKYNKWSGEKIEGSIAFRAKRWYDDYNKFIRLDWTAKMIGLGPDGHLEIAERLYFKKSGNIRQILAPHNGYLIILLESGLIGLSFYLVFIFLLAKAAFHISKNSNIKFPLIYVFLFTLYYGFAQNSELTNIFTFTILGANAGIIVLKTGEIVEEDQNESQEVPEGLVKG